MTDHRARQLAPETWSSPATEAVTRYRQGYVNGGNWKPSRQSARQSASTDGSVIRQGYRIQYDGSRTHFSQHGDAAEADVGSRVSHKPWYIKILAGHRIGMNSACARAFTRFPGSQSSVCNDASCNCLPSERTDKSPGAKSTPCVIVFQPRNDAHTRRSVRRRTRLNDYHRLLQTSCGTVTGLYSNKCDFRFDILFTITFSKYFHFSFYLDFSTIVDEC